MLRLLRRRGTIVLFHDLFYSFRDLCGMLLAYMKTVRNDREAVRFDECCGAAEEGESRTKTDDGEKNREESYTGHRYLICLW